MSLPGQQGRRANALPAWRRRLKQLLAVFSQLDAQSFKIDRHLGNMIAGRRRALRVSGARRAAGARAAAPVFN